MPTIETREGIRHKVSRELAQRSPFLNFLLTFPSEDDDTEVIPLPFIEAKVFVWAMEFVRMDCASDCPLALIKRPLPSANLVDAGVPEWANDFLHQKVPFGTELLDLAEAAGFLRLNMLESLCCARIASKIKQGLLSDMFEETPELSRQEEAQVKAQNSWAWEFPASDVSSASGEYGNEEENVSVSVIAACTAADTFIIADVTATAEKDKQGIVDIVNDSRIRQNSSALSTCDEPMRLMSTLAGKVALFC